jgi:serine/threonine protein kinase
MSLDPGTRIGSYEITAKIGEGGMGEVYRATDSKLKREVALKLLLSDFAQDKERLARLEREARLLASLNHPNIAQIHGLEEEHGRRCLVLELIEGETLAEKLAAGPMPVDEALDIARQIALALEAAHEKGIIHRDLKPANVKFTLDGTAKVLDFGIAKSIRSDGGAESQSDLTSTPTITADSTREGVVMGTAPYMSPEQARGKPLGRRSDIWSLGCVLYECLTGKRLFMGDSVTDILAAILHVDPDWSALPANTPPRIQDLLERCLEKDVKKRMRDAGDVGLELERAAVRREWRNGSSGPEQAAAESSDSSRRISTIPLLSILIVGLIAGGVAGWIVKNRNSDIASTPAIQSVARMTHDPGISEWPTWSPDGSQLAFASSKTGNFEINVRRVDGGQEINVTDDPADDYQPAFSPNGDLIAFVSTRSSITGMIKIGATFGMEFRTYGGDVWIVPSLGGRARRLARNGNFPVWHPDGTSVAYVSGQENHRSIMEVPQEGGVGRSILATEQSQWEIVRVQYHPNGKTLTFEDVEGQVYLIDRSGGKPKLLFQGRNHVWDSTGIRLYYLNRDPLGGTRILSVVFLKSRKAVSESSTTVGLMTGVLRDLAVARDGTQLAFSELEGSLNLTRVQLSASGDETVGPEEELSHGNVIDRNPTISPAGTHIAYVSDRLGRMEIWVLELESKKVERLSLPGEDEGVNLPIWSRDGRTIFLTRTYAARSRSLWRLAIDGSEAEELIGPAVGAEVGRVSADGTEMSYVIQGNDYFEVRAIDLKTMKTRPLIEIDADVFDGAWSPDGKWVSFVSNKSGALQIWRVPASGGEAERLTRGNDRIRHFRYSADGKWIYVQPNHQNIYRIPASGGAMEPVTRFPASGLFMEEPDLSPDGRYLVYCKSNGGASLWHLKLSL